MTVQELKWYENKDNIGKLCITNDTGEVFIMKTTMKDFCIHADRELNQSQGCDFVSVMNCKPLTNETITQFIIKD